MQTKKDVVIDIILETFDKNRSTNFVIRQDSKRSKRLKTLIEYSYFLGEKFGKIYLTKDKKGAAIVLYPELKKTSLSTIYWDVKLITQSIGLKNLFRVFKREKQLEKNYPSNQFIHLWYVGVKESEQGRGIGKKLIEQIISEGAGKTVYLETSNELVFPMYEKIGFRKKGELVYDDYYLRIYQYS